LFLVLRGLGQGFKGLRVQGFVWGLRVVVCFTCFAGCDADAAFSSARFACLPAKEVQEMFGRTQLKAAEYFRKWLTLPENIKTPWL